MTLLEKIRHEVEILDPTLVIGAEDYNACCLVLLLNVCQIEGGWDGMETGAKLALEIQGDQIPQMITNLRLGGALLESGFVDSIQESMDGEGSGFVCTLLCNIALGRMRYSQSRKTYSLTPVGVAYVETKLLPQ